MVGKLTEQVHLVQLMATGIPVQKRAWNGQEGLSGGHSTPLACSPVARTTRGWAGEGRVSVKAPGLWGLGGGRAATHQGLGGHMEQCLHIFFNIDYNSFCRATKHNTVREE